MRAAQGLALALALAAGGCVVPDADSVPDADPMQDADLAANEQAIVNGTLETGRPAVVFMFRADGAACTGTIIAPRVVLTADHCVAGAPPRAFRIYVGTSASASTAEYRVSEVRRIAGGSIRNAEDVALLILSTDAGEPPMEIARQHPNVLAGQTVTAVGYGQTPDDQSGVKLTTTMAIDGFDGGFIFVSPSVCSGDSGGPLLGPDERIYGVASFIYSPDGMNEPVCGSAPGAYNEIYRHLDFIDGALRDTGVCIPQGEEICNGEDDDCDGEVDEGCLAFGEACERGDECVGGVCEATSAGRICTEPCDPLRPSMGCAEGLHCEAEGGCEGFCVPGGAGSAPHGAACSAHTDCASLFCDDPGDRRRRCLEPCRGDGGHCLAGEVCAAGAGACGACVPSELVSGARGLGEACAADGECRGAMVCHLDANGLGECASSCTGASPCEVGFQCREGLCLRDRRQGTGGSCFDNADCLGGICAAQGERRWCTNVCDSPDACPSGLDCVDAGGARICVPAQALEGEDCTGNADCVTGLCAIRGDRGVCTSHCSGHDACGAGFECRRTEDDAATVCLPPSGGGGCSVGARSGSPLPFVVLLAAAFGLVLVRRR